MTRLCLNFEERLILKLLLWAGYQQSSSTWEGVGDSDVEAQRLLSEATSMEAKRYYFGRLQLSPSQVHISHTSFLLLLLIFLFLFIYIARLKSTELMDRCIFHIHTEIRRPPRLDFIHGFFIFYHRLFFILSRTKSRCNTQSDF